MSVELAFFDTNTLVYANDRSYPEKQEKARTLIHDAVRTGTGCLSTQVLAEFWVTVTRKLKSPLDAASAREQILLFTSFFVQSVDQATVLEALNIQQRYGLSYWDSQIIASASFAKAKILYSEDLHDGGEYLGITVHNPFK